MKSREIAELEETKIMKALDEPIIKQWVDQFHLPEGTDVRAWIAHPNQNYDYRTAILQGLRPSLDKQSGQLHWPDLDSTGSRPLKDRKHPTYRYTKQDLAPQKSSAEQVDDYLFEPR